MANKFFNNLLGAGDAAPTVLHKIDVGRNTGGTVAGWEDDSAYRIAGTGASQALSYTTTGITYPATNAVYNTALYGTVREQITGLTPGGTYTLYVQAVWDGTLTSFQVKVNGATVGTINYGASGVVVEGQYTVTADGSGILNIVADTGTPFPLINAIVVTT